MMLLDVHCDLLHVNLDKTSKKIHKYTYTEKGIAEYTLATLRSNTLWAP